MGDLANSFDPKKYGLTSAAEPASASASTSTSATSATSAASASQPSDQPDIWTRWLGLKSAQEYDPNWKPTGSFFHDVMNRPLAKTEGVGEALRDYGLSAADAASFGQASRVVPQQLIDQANANLGVMAPVAQAGGYALGPGKVLGPLTRGGAALTGLGRVGASVLAGGAEGAAAGGLGAAGHGGDTEDIVRNALVGGVTGGAAGSLGGMGPKPKVPEVGTPGTGTAAPTGMYAAKEAGFAPLDTIAFHGPSTYQPRLAGVYNDLRQQRNQMGLPGVSLNIPPEVESIIQGTAKSPGIGQQINASGRNLQQASRDLRATGDVTGHRFADAIDATLANDQPVAGSMYQGAPAQAGNAGTAKAAGDLWHGRIRDLERLGDEPTAADIRAVQQWHDPGSVEGQGLSALQAARQPPVNFWTMRHVAAPLVGAALGGAEGYFNPAEKQNPLVTAGKEALEGMAVFGGGHMGLSALGRSRAASALNEASYRIATGQPTTTPTGRVGDYLANLLYGRLATGQ